MTATPKLDFDQRYRSTDRSLKRRKKEETEGEEKTREKSSCWTQPCEAQMLTKYVVKAASASRMGG